MVQVETVTQVDADRPVAVVTGASSGIGFATSRRLLDLGWRVIGVGRDPQRCAAASADLAATGGDFEMLQVDFSLMAEVSRIAGEIRERTDRLDVLINNAGGVRDRRFVTAEGNEATFAANHLAPFLLTRELMPLLVATSERREAGAVRVIAVSSTAHRAVPGLDWDDLQSLGEFDANKAYCRAKLANLLFTTELARRAPEGVVAQAMHPGVVASNFASHGDERMQAHMASAPSDTPDEAAQTLVWLASDPEGGRDSGRYFHKLAAETPAAAATDLDAAARLWDESERIMEHGNPR